MNWRSVSCRCVWMCYRRAVTVVQRVELAGYADRGSRLEHLSAGSAAGLSDRRDWRDQLAAAWSSRQRDAGTHGECGAGLASSNTPSNRCKGRVPRLDHGSTYAGRKPTIAIDSLTEMQAIVGSLKWQEAVSGAIRAEGSRHSASDHCRFVFCDLFREMRLETYAILVYNRLAAEST